MLSDHGLTEAQILLTLGADLITGVMRLDEYAKLGATAAGLERDRVMRLIRPYDLPFPQRPIWTTLTELHAAGKRLAPRLVRAHLRHDARAGFDWCRTYGEAVGWDTARRSRQMLAIRSCELDIAEAHHVAADAMERRTEAMWAAR